VRGQLLLPALRAGQNLLERLRGGIVHLRRQRLAPGEAGKVRRGLRVEALRHVLVARLPRSSRHAQRLHGGLDRGFVTVRKRPLRAHGGIRRYLRHLRQKRRALVLRGRQGLRVELAQMLLLALCAAVLKRLVRTHHHLVDACH
jgi:hypothetical protein